MKKIANVFVAGCAAAAATACLSPETMRIADNGGYPRSITFPKEGGEMTVSGRETYLNYGVFGQMPWEDLDSERIPLPDDGDSLIYGWMSVVLHKNTRTIKVAAEPSDSSRMRRLYIYCSCDGGYVDIEVNQQAGL